MPVRSLVTPLLAFVVLLLAVLLPDRTARADDPILLRILSYNINHGEGFDSRIDLNRITEVIRSAEPDLIALQEVDQGVARSGRIDQARLLAGRLEMEHAFGGNLELFGGAFGNAILSRFPIIAHENHRLPPHSEGEPRGVLEATVRLPDDGPALRILSTQLDHRRDDRDRLAAADALNAIASSGPPALLAADLNAGPGSPTHRRLGLRWARLGAESSPTVPAQEPTAAFDHILVTPAERWRVVEVRVLEATEASDHRPVLAVLRYLPEDDESPDP